MKKLFVFFGLILLVLFGACNEKKSTEKWSMVWEENFNQGDSFDTTRWSKIPRGKSDWNNYMSDYNDLYAIRDGNLVLRGIQNNVLPNDTAPYLTGGVFTKGKKTFGFGRLEIRAKLNGAEGSWPAFWMLPEDAKWPEGGEIDIMERLSYDKYIYQTVHSNYTHILGIKDKPVASIIATIKPQDYNTYAVERYQDSIVFYVNNTHTKTYPRIETTEVGQFPFSEHDYYLLLDMQLGGSWVGAVNPTTLPVEMYIDWVRFYEPNTKIEE